MGGGLARGRWRLVYPLAVGLLALIGPSAFVSTTASTPAIASEGRHPGPLGKPTAAAVTPLPAVATVLTPSAFDRLQADLNAIAAQTGGRVGISLQELSGPRRNSLSINGMQSFTAASQYKVPLLMAEAQQIVSGAASPSDVLCYDPSDEEDGWFTDYQPGMCFSRNDLAIRAGIYSDNTAAHILVRYLGGPDALNAYAKSIGMNASALWIPNTTTPDDLAAAWVAEALGQLGGSPAQQWLYPLLTHTVNEQGIPAGLPAGATAVHKFGTIDGAQNDSAYVVSGRIVYVLAVAVEGLDDGAAWASIGRVSARVWQYEAGRPDFKSPPVGPAPAPFFRPNHR